MAAVRLLGQPAYGLGTEEREALAMECCAVLAAPKFARLFGPGSRAEVAIVGRVGDAVISGQIDRLVVTSDEILVVDYKTNRPPPRTVAEVPAIYLRQMAAYRAVLRDIYPDKPITRALLWTDELAMMEFPGALLDGHAPRFAP